MMLIGATEEIGMALTPAQVGRYDRDGFLCPVDVFDDYDAALLRRQLEGLEARVAGNEDREGAIRNNSNWVVPWFDDLARTPAIVDAVASILGPDVLVLHVDLFVKEPRSPQFISWHQDLHYWGLDSDNEVTAWLALSPATAESGCMRFVRGSHRSVVEHTDTFVSENMLTRGQQIAVDVNEDEAVLAELEPGQMSLHHGRLFHASGSNESCDRRIGIAIRYISPDVDLAGNGARMGASLVRGEDRHGHFELMEPPSAEFEPKAMRDWKRLRAVEEAILYAGVDRVAS